MRLIPAVGDTPPNEEGPPSRVAAVNRKGGGSPETGTVRREVVLLRLKDGHTGGQADGLVWVVVPGAQGS